MRQDQLLVIRGSSTPLLGLVVSTDDPDVVSPTLDSSPVHGSPPSGQGVIGSLPILGQPPERKKLRQVGLFIAHYTDLPGD